MKRIRKYIQSDIDLNSTNRKFYLVAFTVFTAFVFLNFFEPFGLYYEGSITKEDVFIELFIAMTLAFVVLLLSQFVIRVLFNINRFTVISLFFWFLLEAVFVASIWFVFEVLDKDFIGNLITVWFDNLLAYVLIMFPPYFLYVSYIHIKDVIKNLENENITNKSVEKILPDITLKDENEIVKLVLKTENLLFIQAADNYVEVNFLENGVLSKSLLRNSIKKLEPTFMNTPIIRCHRSFIVNTSNIELAKRTSSGFNLKLNQVSELTIPISKSYISEFNKVTTKP
ncbi:LytR/AlgR family response regulator transcription factor [Maribacter antarcticus]|uniref:LytR/AlgR family response regulator transcription factor n=1 Tax=Maribacter antarcticus TaxID=505250 RepID=UPI00047B1D4C|nr:LytTR family transcriptional regulator DNA-binding domain-containing protein [Maribacter antarcticus]